MRPLQGQFVDTVVCVVRGFGKGAIDTARNVLPMAYSQNSKKMLDEINIRFFTVFELGALVGPVVQVLAPPSNRTAA